MTTARYLLMFALAMVAALIAPASAQHGSQSRGMAVEYAEPAGATHGGMIEPTTPAVLEFFSGRARRGPAR